MSDATLAVELHCHTVHSMDGLMTFDSLVETARRVGLDVVAITDHDTVAGALEFQRRARELRLPLEIIVGEERTLDDGSHFIGLFLQRHIEPVTFEGAIQDIEKQGGLCLIPHPFRRKDGLLREKPERFERLRGRVAGFEMYNAKCDAATNERARELLGSGLGVFGGSDAHYECDLGECVNRIARDTNLRASIEGMLRGTSAVQIYGRRQVPGAKERAYAPGYYRVKKYVALPKVLVPAAKACYRRYRNWKYGVGPKPLVELYRHA